MKKIRGLLYILIGLSLLTLFIIIFDCDIKSWYIMFENFLDNQSIIMLFSGVILSALATLGLIHIFRPNIEIASVIQCEEQQCQKDKYKKSDDTSPYKSKSSDENSNYRIKIKVKNKRLCSWANNVQIEAAFINNDNKTFHLDFDRESFLIIQSREERTFQAMNLNDFTIRLSVYDSLDDMINSIKDVKNIRPYSFRVRVHAEHSFTGFGKSFERTFSYKNGVFIDSDSC